MNVCMCVCLNFFIKINQLRNCNFNSHTRKEKKYRIYKHKGYQLQELKGKTSKAKE